jgi:glucoamylase
MHALIYLAASQLPDGGFHQNFWVTGEPYWTGIQLDEVAFPILLAWRLHMAGGLQNFDPYDMVVRAAGYLVRHGPATPQDRWEEIGGYSPSTLASNIAALTCAASWCKERGDFITSSFLQEYADFLECHIERWTVTRQGALHPEISRHFIRINPAGVDQEEDPDRVVVRIANRGPAQQNQFPAAAIVDAGFLELVRYGVRRFDDSLIVDSLKVVDHVIKGAPALGPVWHRYNHDGYGQRSDGGPFDGWGIGRPWPLLTGERGHYELAAGRDVTPYISAMETFAHGTGLLPEQIWDEPDRPEQLLRFGSATGAAIPLMWAHAEYIKLLRSVRDGRVYDFIPEVADRYQKRRDNMLEIWKPNRQSRSVGRGDTLRVQAPGAFALVWSRDEWENTAETISIPTRVGVEYVDIPIPANQQSPIRFTFRWAVRDQWAGEDYRVDVT